MRTVSKDPNRTDLSWEEVAATPRIEYCGVNGWMWVEPRIKEGHQYIPLSDTKS